MADGTGGFYIATDRLRHVSGGKITTVLGKPGGDATGIGEPIDMVRDASDNIYVLLGKPPGIHIQFGGSDVESIRKISPSGVVTKIAGCGSEDPQCTTAWTPGPALHRAFPTSSFLATDGSSLFFTSFAGTSTSQIFRINLGTGQLTTFATPDLSPISLAVHGSDLYFLAGDITSGSPTHGLYRAPIAGGAITKIKSPLPLAPFYGAALGMVVSTNGITYIASHGIQRADLSKVITVNGAGSVGTYAGTGVDGFSGDGGQAGDAKLSIPFDVDIDSFNNILVADTANGRVRRIALESAHYPFPTWDEFVKIQLEDFAHASSTEASRAPAVEQLSSGATTSADYIYAQMNGPWFAPHMAPVARLYWAFFGRIPDRGGLESWAAKHRSGTPLDTISQAFAQSSEFKTKYGSLSNRAFVKLVYTNVLGRAGNTTGVNYWTDQLDTHKKNRGQVMTGFSESPEFRTKKAGAVNVSMAYDAMLQRSPTTDELAVWAPQPATTIIESIRISWSYFLRFG
ncbi:MAG: hypothetical protein JWM05_351 [Acidimicrobiales bacterium]|nr:hypothetical protein [Acidimicrobiales bacterium]